MPEPTKSSSSINGHPVHLANLAIVHQGPLLVLPPAPPPNTFSDNAIVVDARTPSYSARFKREAESDSTRLPVGPPRG